MRRRKTTIKHDLEAKDGVYHLECLSNIVRELDERISKLEGNKKNE